MYFKSLLYIIFLSSVLAVCTEGYSQNGKSALEKDPRYAELLQQEKNLYTSQDSITKVISAQRDLFRTDEANKTKYAEQINTLELQLFDIRSQLSTITTKLNALEQEYVLRNLDGAADVRATESDVQHKHLLTTQFIKDNVSKSEMSTLRNNAKTEKEIEQLGEEFLALYQIKKKTGDDYNQAATKTIADSIVRVWSQLEETQQRLEKNLSEKWLPVFTLKYDVYRRLLDKLSAPIQVIEQLDEESRTTRSNEANAMDRYNSASFYIYPQQRKLLLSYEKALSEVLKIMTKDSLDNVIRSIKLDQYAQEPITIARQTFVDFHKITIAGDSVHSETTPITALKVPSKGSMYKIEIGTYAKPPTSLATFRKIYPIQYDILEDGKYRYYAGTYPSPQEAQHDLDRLKRMGIKIRLVEWKDGVELDAEGKPIIRIKHSDAYRIVFPTMTEPIKAIVDSLDGKELSRITNEGKQLYSIGVFDTQEEALEVAGKIGASAKVIGVDL